MRQIPWERYSEEEIQELLRLYFRSLGYSIYPAHKVDRRGERGADLWIFKSRKDSIALAVKKKPTKKDLWQLVELSRRPEHNKIYVFSQDPSADFKMEQSNFSDKVIFWDSPKLTEEIFSNNPYFGRVF